MRLCIYLALLAAAALPQVLAPMSRRLAPKPAATALAVGALLAGLVWVLGLGLLAVATLARVSTVGAESGSTLNAPNPVPVATGIISAVLLAFAAVALGAATWRLRRGLIQLGRLHAACLDRRCGDLTVIDSATPEALVLPGWRGSVVVTSGMLQALEPTEQQVLLAHERSHLHGAHWLFRLATRLGAALLPTARPLVKRCDDALERWADEVAADVVGDRHLTATAVAKAALATTDHHRSALVPGFSDGGVVERVEALLAPPRASRWGFTAVPFGTALIAVAAIIEATRDLEAFFETVKHVWPF